jgi:hypothetical protein
MSRALRNIPPYTASDLASEYGRSARYWIKMAADGKIPGAWQPSGPGGQWAFERRAFEVWRTERQQQALKKWQPSTRGARHIGRAPSVKAENTAQACVQRLEQRLKIVLGNG